MRSTRRFASIAALLGALALSACGSSAPASTPPSSAASASPSSAAASAAKPGGSAGASGTITVQSLVAAAKKEGALTFAYGGGTLGGNDGIAKLAAAFNKTYGLNLNVQVVPGEGMPAMVAKITQEYQAKKPASTDVVLSLADTMSVPIDAKSILVPDWRSWAPNIQKIDSPDLITPDGSSVVIQTFMAGISYNTNKIPKDQVPKTMEDLLKPQFKGKIASTVYATAFDWLATDNAWGHQKTLDYVTKLSKQVAGLMRCGEDSRVATGEFEAFALDCSQSLSLKLKAQGDPVDYAVPSDAEVEEYVYAAIPKTAPHPNASKLWIDFLVSPQGQEILRQVDYTDSTLTPNSMSGKLVEQASAGGGKPLVASVQNAKKYYLPNGPKYKDEFTKILLGK